MSSRIVSWVRPLGRGAGLVLSLGLGAGCSFSPDALVPASGVYGDACASGSECASGVCGPAATCVECRIAATCGAGRICEEGSGRCVEVVVPPTGPRVHVPAAGAESTNGIRTHVGRVAVVPVSSSEVR